jgi:hypothetical protein
LVRCMVIVEDKWMVHRDFRNTLLKVVHWISACGHHVGQKTVSIRFGNARAINETELDCSLAEGHLVWRRNPLKPPVACGTTVPHKASGHGLAAIGRNVAGINRHDSRVLPTCAANIPLIPVSLRCLGPEKAR